MTWLPKKGIKASENKPKTYSQDEETIKVEPGSSSVAIKEEIDGEKKPANVAEEDLFENDDCAVKEDPETFDPNDESDPIESRIKNGKFNFPIN